MYGCDFKSGDVKHCTNTLAIIYCSFFQSVKWKRCSYKVFHIYFTCFSHLHTLIENLFMARVRDIIKQVSLIRFFLLRQTFKIHGQGFLWFLLSIQVWIDGGNSWILNILFLFFILVLLQYKYQSPADVCFEYQLLKIHICNLFNVHLYAIVT